MSHKGHILKLLLIYLNKKGIIMKRVGLQTIIFDNPPTILETSSIVGPKNRKDLLLNISINV